MQTELQSLMRYGLTGDTIWSAFVARRFGNHLRSLPRLSHLMPETR